MMQSGIEGICQLLLLDPAETKDTIIYCLVDCQYLFHSHRPGRPVDIVTLQANHGEYLSVRSYDFAM